MIRFSFLLRIQRMRFSEGTGSRRRRRQLLSTRKSILTLRSCGSALSATDIAAVRAFDDHAFDETSLSGPWACATLLGSCGLPHTPSCHKLKISLDLLWVKRGKSYALTFFAMRRATVVAFARAMRAV